ncbi:SIR2 family protein [Hymenobacter canadensis]|uniref:SIR2 family protein n=1 Tax=Hymenobacter canadensis TaxID=2999067 RepID=A0ABY7LVA1_9BACT|nr:SIR2 family protein [Hymenobacter canadensis]WBA44312.1 SIR2 family protein [Hymenobacter canadensis]
MHTEASSLPFPNELKKAIETDSLIVFTGAGTSRKFDLPSWNKLAIDIINDLDDESFKTLIPAIVSGKISALYALTLLENEKYKIRQYIENNFCLTKDKDFGFHNNLIELSGKIVTTNYDNAFELANSDVYSAVHNSAFKISSLKNKQEFIFKLHGCAKTDSSSCVVFENDYDKLYSDETAAIFKLKELFINNTFLFIGFSLNDPYVVKIFQHIDKIFDGNCRHYILSTSELKFPNLNCIKSLVIDDYNQIDALVDYWLEYKRSVIKSREVISFSIDKTLLRRPKVAVLSPNPVDLSIKSELPKLSTLLDSLDVDIYNGYLNVRNMQLIEDYDYVFIVTKSFKDKIYIEDENLKSTLISLDELDKYLLDDSIPVILIVDKEISFSGNINLVNICTYKNNIINRFIFKFIRRGLINVNEPEIKVFNMNKVDITIDKGKSKNHSINEQNRVLDFNVKGFSVIGRVEEQSNIASRMIDIIHSHKLLNVKGSGGIGKTTLIRKISSELYDRGYFTQGVTFNSCEYTNTFSDFKDLLSKGFKLNEVIDLKEYLQEIGSKIDMMIILDNFESISTIDDRSEYEKIIDLLEFATDYANIVLTSRENLNTHFEDIYTLSSLNTDDAVKLFISSYGEVKKEELSILRIDILENILNNNPLAIKLVTKTIVPQSGILNLKKNLEEDLFKNTSEDFINIYKKDVDMNIEKTRSIYQSINYSYCKLNVREKLALEILNLFPDGISVSNFKKCFEGKKSYNNISETELRNLQNKSLVEGFNGLIRLQPIIRKFAEFQFNKRPKEIRDKFCSDAYSYNCFIVDALNKVSITKGASAAYILQNNFKNNLLNVLDFVNQIEISDKSILPEKKYLLNYIYEMDSYVIGENQVAKFVDKLEEIKPYFNDIDDADKLLDTLKYHLIYYNKDFDYSYKRMQELYPASEVINRSDFHEDYVKRRYVNMICAIHSMEGHTLEYVHSCIVAFNKIEGEAKKLFHVADNHLFYLGVHVDLDRHDKSFYTFEKQAARGTDIISGVEKYMKTLFEEEHLERIQCVYTLSKVTDVDKNSIRSLVVTNPYTRGLKELMHAFVEKDPEAKRKYFDKALKYLMHIKYYYLEALYFYCKFLMEINNDDFTKNYELGLELSKKYFYQFLVFKFESLLDNSKEYSFSYNYYPIEGLESYAIIHKKYWDEIALD